MTETGVTELGTLTLGKCAHKGDIDSALWRLLADELHEGVDAPSPEARQPVPDLSPVPIVAETGGGGR